MPGACKQHPQLLNREPKLRPPACHWDAETNHRSPPIEVFSLKAPRNIGLEIQVFSEFFSFFVEIFFFYTNS
jgi:hypothetical protein